MILLHVTFVIVNNANFKDSIVMHAIFYILGFFLFKKKAIMFKISFVAELIHKLETTRSPTLGI